MSIALRRLAVAAVLALVAAGCGADDPTVNDPGAGSTATLQIGGEEANDHGTADVSGETRFAVELGDNYFEPTVLSGEGGQTVTLELTNEGAAPHTFTIDAADVDVELEPGASDEVRVTFPDDGAVVFHCHFHDAQGMRGALSVGGSLEVVEDDEAGGHEDMGEEEGEAGGDDDGGKY